MMSYITDLPMRMTPWDANGCLIVSVYITDYLADTVGCPDGINSTSCLLIMLPGFFFF